MQKSNVIAALVLMTAPLLLPPAAVAQFGLYQLPTEDFTWYWGDSREVTDRRGFADFQVSGSESVFRCELTARLRASSALSQQEIRQLESDLRGRLDFIYGASEAMNYLEQNFSLDWGMLDCKRPVAGPVDQADRAERESRARDKMQRELERRRARDSRGNADE
jgi:hypothetical protein